MTDLGLDTPSSRRPTLVAASEHFAAAAAVGTLGVVLVSDAGRDTAVMVWVLLVCLPALYFTRPWRHVSTALVTLLAVLPTASIVVSYVTPTGFAYSRDLCVWAYAAVIGVTVLAYARTPPRRMGILLFICVLGFYDVFQAFVPWKYHGDPARAMVGTFYQQDMFGAFCAAIALAAAAVAVLGRSPWRWLGWLIAPPCAVGCLLSTSRAAEGLLLLGALGLGVVAASGPHRWQRLGAWAAILVFSIGLLFLVTGPLFFPAHQGSPLAGTTRRAGSDSLASSSTIRQAYWRAALQEFRDAPLAGEGFGAFGLTFFDRAPVGAFGSRYAHNGFLQGFGEGGLLFGLPLLTLGAAATLTGLRSLVGLRLAVGWDAAARRAAAFGALALVGHTMVDFDWSFPVLAGLLAGLAALSGRVRVDAGSYRVRTLAPVILLVCATVFSAYAVHVGLETNKRLAIAQRLTLSGRTSEAAAVLVAADHRYFRNPLVWSAILSLPPDADVPHAKNTALVERALRETAELAQLDPRLELTRASVLVRAGRPTEGLRLGRQVLARSSRARPDLIGDYAVLLATAGHREQAVQLVSEAIRERLNPRFPLPDNVWRLVESLQSIAGADSAPAACAYSRVEGAFGPASRPAVVPVPSARAVAVAECRF